MGKKANRKALDAVLWSGEPVRLHRSLWKAGRVEGFVVGLSPAWVVVHLLDEVVLDGWAVVRLDTVARVERRGAHDLGSRVLRHQGESPVPLDIDLGDPWDVLADLAEKFPLVAVQREGIDPSGRAIGKPVRLGKRKLHLLDIDPDALWDHAPRRFAYEDITCIEVGSRYAQALHELGGYPPVPR